MVFCALLLLAATSVVAQTQPSVSRAQSATDPDSTASLLDPMDIPIGEVWKPLQVSGGTGPINVTCSDTVPLCSDFNVSFSGGKPPYFVAFISPDNSWPLRGESLRTGLTVSNLSFFVTDNMRRRNHTSFYIDVRDADDNGGTTTTPVNITTHHCGEFGCECTFQTIVNNCYKRLAAVKSVDRAPYIGAAVGGGIGLALAIIAAFFLVRWCIGRRKGRASAPRAAAAARTPAFAPAKNTPRSSMSSLATETAWSPVDGGAKAHATVSKR